MTSLSNSNPLSMVRFLATVLHMRNVASQDIGVDSISGLHGSAPAKLMIVLHSARIN
jgi:hypothetical protein